ncbi:MAG TPA: type VI secretion system-associated protein TagF [Polyangiaceae bacterium]|nr:type VI secretion system-associated protein TagF [Polyangiaceae bacterium]
MSILGFAKRAAPATDLGAGVFGKVISCGDFISAGEYSPAAAHLSRWLEQGVGWAATQAKEAWESVAFTTPRSFLFRPERSEYADRVIFGLLQPSRDSVGRYFPLAIYSELSLGTDLDGYSVLPLVIGDFLESAASILDQAARGADPRGLLQQLPRGVAPRIAGAKSEFAGWAANTAVSTVFAAFFADESTARGYNVLCSLHGIVAPFAGHELPDTPLSLRLPLGSAGIAGAVFWIELVRKILRWKRAVPVCFWHAYVDSGQLVIPLGEPSMRSLLGLWVANELDDAHCDLTVGDAAYGQLPDAISTALSNDVSVAKLLTVL